MELRKFINYLFFVFVFQTVVVCFEFDLDGRNSRRSTFNSEFRRIQHAVYKKPNVYNPIRPITNHNTPREPHYWEQSRNATKQRTYKESKLLFSSVSRYRVKSTTPTYIEFDYLDIANDRTRNTSLKRLHRVESNDSNARGRTVDKTRLPFIWRPSSVSYRFKNPYNVQELRIKPLSNPKKNLEPPSLHSHGQIINPFGIQKQEINKKNIRIGDLVTNKALVSQNLLTVKVYSQTLQAATEKSKTTPIFMLKSTPSTKNTAFTTNDRVKFFELYDINTPPNKIIKLNISNKYPTPKPNNITNIINLDNNNFKNVWGAGLNKTRVERQYKNYEKPHFQKYTNVYKMQANKLSGLSRTTNENSTVMFSKSILLEPRSALAHWSNFPFASVYVYKPTETHCDAAAISPHWLLAAGSCLSRHTLVYSVDVRSAFVTYCGEHWRWPERIAYVKRSVVHPEFNSRDEARRLLYNIALIQVSSSMATACPRWAPIELMSHPFSTGPSGAIASAIGWGLDRYGSQYTTEKLPHRPLSVYNAVVHHDVCPGSSMFNLAKRQDDSCASNLYCLMLPPYAGEESDPVHGGILMADEHLVALYLQEERRSWGIQSAQYTGVWRLLPWITDVAQEPSDESTFDV